MPQTTNAPPIRSVYPSGSPRKITPIRTAVRGTTKMWEATLLASPARTRANQIIHASEIPTSPEYNMLATNGPSQETLPHDSTESPNAVSTTPPAKNGSATAQRVETRASYFLKYTVPRAQKNAEPAPRTTPKGERASAAPVMLPALTATIPENPSRSPEILAAVSVSPRIGHARSPTSMGCR